MSSITSGSSERRKDGMWISDFTGELYDSLWHALITIARDMLKIKACRTIRMFAIRRYTPSPAMAAEQLDMSEWVTEDDLPFD